MPRRTVDAQHAIRITCQHCDQHCKVLATERGTTTTVYCPQCERRYEIFIAEHGLGKPNPWTRPLPGVSAPKGTTNEKVQVCTVCGTTGCRTDHATSGREFGTCGE